MKMLFFLVAAAPLFGQSHAIQLCDQQHTRHCVTWQIPRNISRNVTCTLGGLGTCGGIALGADTWFDGDSLSAGYGLTHSADLTGSCRTSLTDATCLEWPSQLLLLPSLSGARSKHNLAISYGTISQAQTRYTASIHPVSPVVTGLPGILFLYCGSNDLVIPSSAATIEALLATYWSGAKADGFTMVAFTVAPRGDSGTTAAEDAVRIAVNAWIRDQWRSGAFDYLVDMDKIMSNTHDLTLMQADFVHPNATGHYLQARSVNSILLTGSAVSGSAVPAVISNSNVSLQVTSGAPADLSTYSNVNGLNQNNTTGLNPGVTVFNSLFFAMGMDLGHDSDWYLRLFAPNLWPIKMCWYPNGTWPTLQSDFTCPYTFDHTGNFSITGTFSLPLMAISGGGLNLINTGLISWQSTGVNYPAGTTDTGLRRTGAGQLKVEDGAGGQGTLTSSLIGDLVQATDAKVYSPTNISASVLTTDAVQTITHKDFSSGTNTFPAGITLPISLSGTDVTGTLAAARFPALTGDVTTTAGALATTLKRLTPTSTSPACAVTGDVGNLWLDNTSAVTTHFRICVEVASVPTFFTVF